MNDPGPPESDESLVRAFQLDPRGRAGRDAAEELLARWSGRTFIWAYRFTGERESALDLAQDCLIRVFLALPRYEPRGKFSAWVFTIVHNAARDFGRRRRPIPMEGDLDVDSLPTPQAGPEHWLERKDDQRRVLEVMRDSLTPDERTALWMRAYEGLGVDEITRALELKNASGARALLQAARRKLRAALGAAAPGGMP